MLVVHSALETWANYKETKIIGPSSPHTQDDECTTARLACEVREEDGEYGARRIQQSAINNANACYLLDNQLSLPNVQKGRSEKKN